MTARSAVAGALLAAVLLAAGCGRKEEAGPPPAPEAPSEPTDSGGGAETIEKVSVTVYFPSADADDLVGESREIFATARPADRAKQIVAELISGPSTPGGLPALPEGTRLRQLFILDDGTAWADFSGDLAAGTGGGSRNEILSVYAVVDSLVLNVPEIRRVGILLDGGPCETLSGHLDLRRPLPADRTLVGSPAEPEPAPAADDPPGGVEV